MNVERTGEFVVNVVSGRIAEAMNQCSAESPSDIDEFDLSGLTPALSVLVKAPRVKEAPAHLGMQAEPAGQRQRSAQAHHRQHRACA